MAAIFRFALFFFCALIIAAQIDAWSDHSAAQLLEYNELLDRLKTLTEILETKYIRAENGVDNKMLTPEVLIKMQKYSLADYMFIRLLALYANYEFNDDKLPFIKWRKGIIKRIDLSHEHKKENDERKEHNAKTADDFVATVCALVRQTAIYWNRFYEYIPIFERMDIIKKAIEEKAKHLTTWKVKWENFAVEKQSLNRLSGQSIWGLLDMKAKILTPKFMMSKPTLNNKLLESFDVVFNRKDKITKFLVNYLSPTEAQDFEAHPEKFLVKAAEAIDDEAVGLIFGHLAKTFGYAKWLEEFEKMGGVVVDGKKPSENKGEIVAASNSEPSEAENKEESKDDDWEEISHSEHQNAEEDVNAADDGNEVAENNEKKKLNIDEMRQKGIGKVVNLITKIYLMVWEAPFNMELHKMQDFHLVHERLLRVEEHYRKKLGADNWNKKVEEAKTLLDTELPKEIEIEEKKNAKAKSYGRGDAAWGWAYSSENFVRNTLWRVKNKALDRADEKAAGDNKAQQFEIVPTP